MHHSDNRGESTNPTPVADKRLLARPHRLAKVHTKQSGGQTAKIKLNKYE